MELARPEDEIEEETQWTFQIIPEMVAQQLQRTVKDNAIVAPLSWTYHILKTDSLSRETYLNNFCKRIKFNHYFYGFLAQKNERYVLYYRLNSMDGSCVNDSITFSNDQISELNQTIVKNIAPHLLKQKDVLARFPFTSSVPALQHYMKGYKLHLEQNYLASIQETREAIALDAKFSEAYLLNAKNYLALAIDQKAKDINEAQPLFDQTRFFLIRVMKLDSTNDESYRLFAEYYIYNERWSQAEISLLNAKTMNSNNPFIYIPISRMHEFRYRNFGFRDEKQLFERAIYLNPCYEDAYLMLSDYYLFQNNRTQAIQTLNEYLQINPNSVPILMALSKIYIMRNEMENITEILNKIIELDPPNTDAYYNLGVLYYNSKDYENALKYFQRAVEVNNHLNSYLYLAYLNELNGDIDNAIEYLRTRIRQKTGPDDEFAEEARKHLFKLIQSDSTKRKEMELQLQK